MRPRTITAISYFVRFLWHAAFIPYDNGSGVIYDAVTSLGGVYIKLIQFLCLRTEIFSDSDKMRFLSFYDRAPYEPLDIMRLLKNELSAKDLSQFKYLDRKPFAAGSFAQVYKAVLHDGSDVIIKAKRRKIASKIKSDLRLLKVFSFVFDLLYPQRLIDVPKLLSEFCMLTYRELDYETEVQNAEYMYSYYKDHPTVKIPKTYVQLSTRSFIVQEFIDGVPLTQIIRYRYENLDYKSWLKEHYNTDIFTLLKGLPYEMGVQMFNLDKYYADPHPGNILLLPEDRYAIIDFGILGNSPRNKRTYYELLQTITGDVDSMDMKKFGEELMKFGAREFYKDVKVLDYTLTRSEKSLIKTMIENLSMELDETKERMRAGESTSEYDFSQMFVDSISKGSKFSVRAPAELFAMMRGSQLYKSYAVFLEPSWVHMRKTYVEILASVDKTKLVDRDDVLAKKIEVEDALESVIDWAGNVAEDDLPLYLKIDNMLQTITNA